ncbi:MAG: ORF6N domain-containing protein [Bacteroidales bacterium]|jgi:phage regulator Rha-like protein|nr:ORF6N domain-containing protein [Bacteroidales bacterium]
MSNPIKFSQVEEKILTIRGEKVILDSDVAVLYGVETRDINKSVKNNPDKFPEGYIFELDDKEFTNLRWKNSTTNLAKTRVLPKAFTEKGLYMLATILKSPQATETTIAIVEAFAKLRDLARIVAKISETTEETEKKSLMQKSSEIIDEILGDDLKTTETETCIEVDLILMKFKHTTKRK